MVTGQVGEPAAGQVVMGRFRLEERVGLGGMGQVWRATDLELGRVVAVKRSRSVSDRAARQLRREARLAAGLRHPNVVVLHDVLTAPDGRWLVMEYLPWPSLAELLRRGGPLPPRRAARLGVQLAGALAALHAAGVVHGDVKPGNILVSADGSAKLTDFGLARAHAATAVPAGEPGDPEPGLVPGTPAYLAPEVARGGRPGPPSDVFSLGATLYAAVVGEPPFGAAASPQALLRRSAGGVVRVPPRAGALAPVLRAVLRAEPAERPDAARARLLLDAAGRRPVRRRVSAAVAAAAVLVLAGALAGDGAGPAAVPLAGVLGEPRTADPCGLTDPAALTTFGAGEEKDDYGNFNRCDVLVRPAGGTEVDVRAELDLDDGTPAGPVTDLTGVPVRTQPADDGECDRTVPLPGGYAVYVAAVLDSGKVRGSRLCAMADAATGYVAAVLRRGRLPRRTAPFPAGSLARTDACALPGTAALAAVPGLAAAQPERGYAGWECGWDGDGGDLSVLLRFDRNGPLDPADDGTPVRLAGHEAYLQPGGDGAGTCVARVVRRGYRDSAGEPTVELLYLRVAGSDPAARLCSTARAVATAAASRLPPPE